MFYGTNKEAAGYFSEQAKKNPDEKVTFVEWVEADVEQELDEMIENGDMGALSEERIKAICQKALKLMHDCHDCEVGMNYDVMREAISRTLEEQNDEV